MQAWLRRLPTASWTPKGRPYFLRDEDTQIEEEAQLQAAAP